jgi:hypothetical protein
MMGSRGSQFALAKGLLRRDQHARRRGDADHHFPDGFSDGVAAISASMGRFGGNRDLQPSDAERDEMVCGRASGSGGDFREFNSRVGMGGGHELLRHAH